MIRLSLSTLDDLPANIGRPTYARENLKAGILHFGIGNFHRAHQAMYLDRLMSAGKAQEWGIIGAGVFESERRLRDTLAAQDWLTTLVEQSAEISEARVIGSMVDFIEPANASATIARMVQPDIRIVSLTITEGGYFLDGEGNFDLSHPAIQADATSPDIPKTVFGMILTALRARREAGTSPFTVMSCDNIPHNGAVTRETLTGLARLSDPAFADWITTFVAFPNSMVDRITPATSDRERAILAGEYDIEDGWPVFCEDFTQWILEDNFPSGRPPFEEVAAQFVEDVAPFELMKLRILNGGHAAIAYPAALMDIHFVHDAMAHPLIRDYLRALHRHEIIPTIPPIPGIDLAEYADCVERRFANPKIADTIPRLCHDGSNRQPKFILPTLRDALLAGRKVDGLALESALWCRYCTGLTVSGAPIPANDPNWDHLSKTAITAKETPRIWLEMEDVYGDLSENAEFAERFSFWLNAVWSDGPEGAIRAWVSSADRT